MFETLLEILLDSNTEQTRIQEYIKGGRRAAAKYIQRFGIPGSYSYVYPNKQFERFSRRARFFFARFMKKSQKFIQKIKTHYDATKVGVRPKTWHTMIIDVQKKDGDLLQFHVNARTHQIHSYRSRKSSGGASMKLSKAKRQGILRYK